MLKKITVKQWLIIGVFNFLIVAIYGLLMRYKILFSLPAINQKFIMHAHSHFAFSGWVSQLLMLLMITCILKLQPSSILPLRYQCLLILNLFFSFGMLITFSIGGYFVGSIVFSFLIVLLSYVFSFMMWRDVSKSNLPIAVNYVFKGALFFAVISSLGTYSLMYLKITHDIDPLKQLASVYFYLHFQYNGWFLMGCLGLFMFWVYSRKEKLLLSKPLSILLIGTVVPTYFLSVLWWKNFPDWLFYILVSFVLLQTGIWARLLFRLLKVKNSFGQGQLSLLTRLMWMFVGIALVVKVILQNISVIPSLSQLVYGFRPIVIAYLHLVLLGIVSIFLMAYSLSVHLLLTNRLVNMGIVGLLVGVFLNELLLLLQGTCGLYNICIAYTNEGLLGAAVLMVSSLAFIATGQLKRQEFDNS